MRLQHEKERRKRHFIGFVFAALSTLLFLLMICFVGAMQMDDMSILKASLGSIGSLLAGVFFFWLSNCCLYDYEP